MRRLHRRQASGTLTPLPPPPLTPAILLALDCKWFFNLSLILSYWWRKTSTSMRGLLKIEQKATPRSGAEWLDKGAKKAFF
jgi:hypothetical protein